MDSRNLTCAGFSLIETVIVIALGAMTMLALSLLIYSFNKTSVYEQTAAQSSGSASAILREVESLALPADAVLQTHVFPGATYTSSSTALVLEIPSIDNSGVAIPNTYDYAVFYSVGTNAYRLLDANVLSKRVSGTKQLSTTLNTLTFSYDNADFAQVTTVTVTVQMRVQVKQDILTDHRSEQLRLRNH